MLLGSPAESRKKQESGKQKDESSTFCLSVRATRLYLCHLLCLQMRERKRKSKIEIMYTVCSRLGENNLFYTCAIKREKNENYSNNVDCH